MRTVEDVERNVPKAREALAVCKQVGDRLTPLKVMSTAPIIAEIVGKNGQVTGIVTTSGARIQCDIVIIAIGIEPIVDFIKGSGIPCDQSSTVSGSGQRVRASRSRRSSSRASGTARVKG